MAKKRILAVGLHTASEDITHEDISSKTSLLDWDIVIFRPEITKYIYNSSEYMGKPSLLDRQSFALKESCEHWRREIKGAFDNGKTVVVYLSPLQEVYIDTGKREYSGTGRNQKTTTIVDVYSNYNSLPVNTKPIIARGTEMMLSPRGAEVLSSYWAEFGPVSSYSVRLTATDVPACLVTRTGDIPVGALYRGKGRQGALILLPDINFRPAEFIMQRNDREYWTSTAKQFASRFVASIIALDKELRSNTTRTAQPLWASVPEYELSPEIQLRIDLLEAERQVELAQKRKEEITDAINNVGTLRSLLFEKGKPLEDAIIDALRLFGFDAKRFKDSDSEFDVVFESSEGRLIGEAEGKDSKPINIEKLRQLSMNIHEDLERDEVSSPAKPVLFGNGCRLQKPSERTEVFTEKCRNIAETTSTALVFTPDLFRPAQYLLESSDKEYAQKCRAAILNGIGRVAFPPPPDPELKHVEFQVEGPEAT